jgi:hypothetical protein
MGLGKQAKRLTKAQVDAALNYLSRPRCPLRNRVILLPSVKAELRAKEIAIPTKHFDRGRTWTRHGWRRSSKRRTSSSYDPINGE